MPKSNLVCDRTKERARLFTANIDKYMEFHNIKNDELAMHIGISGDTLYRKRKNPLTFKLPEIIRTVEYLKFSEVDRGDLFIK